MSCVLEKFIRVVSDERAKHSIRAAMCSGATGVVHLIISAHVLLLAGKYYYLPNASDAAIAAAASSAMAAARAG